MTHLKNRFKTWHLFRSLIFKRIAVTWQGRGGTRVVVPIMTAGCKYILVTPRGCAPAQAVGWSVGSDALPSSERTLPGSGYAGLPVRSGRHPAPSSELGSEASGPYVDDDDTLRGPRSSVKINIVGKISCRCNNGSDTDITSAAKYQRLANARRHAMGTLSAWLVHLWG